MARNALTPVQMASNGPISRVGTPEMGSKWGQIGLFWRVRNPRFALTPVQQTSKGPEIGSKWVQMDLFRGPKYPKMTHFGTLFGPLLADLGQIRRWIWDPNNGEMRDFGYFGGLGPRELPTQKWAKIGYFGGNTSEYLRY